jgi:hypothetical protein
MKSLPLIYKQIIILLLLFLCIGIGLLLLFGEMNTFHVFMFLLMKALGLFLLTIGIAIFRGILPIIKED